MKTGAPSSPVLDARTGNSYASVRLAARTLKIDPKSIRANPKRFVRIGQPGVMTAPVPVTYDGTEFPSIGALSRHLGWTAKHIQRAIGRGHRIKGKMAVIATDVARARMAGMMLARERRAPATRTDRRTLFWDADPMSMERTA